MIVRNVELIESKPYQTTGKQITLRSHGNVKVERESGETRAHIANC